MRTLIFSTLILGLLAVPAVVHADNNEQKVAASSLVKFSTSETPLGEILDNEKAKALLDKHFPGMSANEQIEMARGMTLVDMQMYSPDDITDEKLKALDADFANLKS